MALPQMGPRRFLHDAFLALDALEFERIRVRPLAPALGAEIDGVDLGKPLDDETFAEIQHAHLAYKVIFFRNQKIDTQQHIDFAARFGELEEHPFLPSKEGHPEIIQFAKNDQVAGVENAWHSDVSWREAPSLGSVLRARDVPSVGGDTLFADMEAAYEGLPDSLKEELEGRSAVHDFSHSFGAAMNPDQLAEQQKRFPAVEHPVIRTHPVTGHKCIYVNTIFTSHIVGMDREESDALLERLFREAAVPEYQCRFRWEADSIAFWDNRCLQHYAASDYWPRKRVMERVTVIGDAPR